MIFTQSIVYCTRVFLIHRFLQEMLNAVVKRIVRGLLFLLGCIVVPITRLRSLFHRRRSCPPISNKILFMTATELADKIRKQEASIYFHPSRIHRRLFIYIIIIIF